MALLQKLHLLAHREFRAEIRCQDACGRDPLQTVPVKSRQGSVQKAAVWELE